MIQRAKNKSPFAAIKIDVIRSGILSVEEIGLYTIMMSRTDNWEFSEFVLAKELGTTPQEIHGILKRLEQKGFARERKGRYGTVWDLCELPDQLPFRRPTGRKAYTIPQDKAKALVDRLMTQAEPGTERKNPADEAQKEAQNREEGRDMTNEEMANAFFAQAQKLKKIAAEKGTIPCRTGKKRV